MVLQFDLEHFPLIYEGETNHVLRQVDCVQAVVCLEHLRQDKEVLRVETLIAEVQLCDSVHLNAGDWHGSTVDADLLQVVFTDEFSKVLERELVHVSVTEVDQRARWDRVQLLTWQHGVLQELS